MTLRIEPAHRRIRAFVDGALVLDTVDPLYVWEGPHYPQWYVPTGDVADGVLRPSAAGTTRRSPSRGTATVFDLVVGDRTIPDAAWTHVDSPIEALRDRVRFEWSALDAWFEEDEEVFVHPRDPATRVQILPSSRHVVVRVDDVVVADTTRPTFLHETHLPRRTYIPRVDVRMDLLRPTDSSTACPYKGVARYWSLVTPAGEHPDIAWSYPTPLRESAPIAGLVAFYDDRVELSVDL